MDAHPIANQFPLLDGAEYEQLKADIQANGLQGAIWTYHGKILDGRNRHRACVELGIEPVFRQYEGDDPEAFVLSMNLHRRHLSPEWRQRFRQERIERVAQKRTEGKSTRQIAEEEGVSQPQIVADLREATDKGLSVGPKGGRVVGRDGRERPSSRPPQPSEPDQPKTVAANVQPAPREPPPQQNGKQQQAPLRFPHSAQLKAWLLFALGQTWAIHIEQKGIRAMLAERDKWDWREVEYDLLPKLEALVEVATEYRTEVQNALEKR